MLEIVKSFLRSGEPPQSGVVRGRYYEREGSCNQCGRCCTDIYLVYQRKTIDSLEMFEQIQAKDPDYRSFQPITQESDGDGLLFKCVHLQPDNTCGVYENRPHLCRQYPSEHGILLGGKLADGCGYSFRLLKTFQDVLRTVAEESGGIPKAEPSVP